MRSPRKRTWFCSTSIVAPRREVSEAGLLELHASRGEVCEEGSREEMEREMRERGRTR